MPRPPSKLRAAFRIGTVLIGWVVLVVAVDLGLGATLDRIAPGAPDAPRTSPEAGDEVAELPDDCLATSPMTEELHLRAESPAFAESPWAHEYWCEFGRLTNEYVPYLFALPGDSRQRHINITDAVRQSYEPAAPPGGADVPEVWFFGGSTMWGWGQRDGHTIPSEVARLSEDAGLPVRVVNLGQLAFVHWQEVLLFERALAARPAPDLVVFYDGVNDVLAQAGADAYPSDDPTIYDFGNFPEAAAPPPLLASDPDEDDSWLETWADSSAVARAARNAGGLLGASPAGAATVQDDVPRDVVIRRTTDIYERGRARALDLARRHGVETAFFWQPNRNDAVDQLTGKLWEADRPAPPQAIDITDVLAHLDPTLVFSDQAHTNELGARIVAEAIWTHLLPQVRAAGAPSEAAGP